MFEYHGANRNARGKERTHERAAGGITSFLNECHRLFSTFISKECSLSRMIGYYKAMVFEPARCFSRFPLRYNHWPSFSGTGGADTPAGSSNMKRSAWTFLLVVVTLSVSAGNISAQQFKKAVYYNVGVHDRPYYVIAAQLTSSGNLDLVVADYLNGQVSILLGNGDGTFQKPLRFSVPSPVALAAGDFNGDHTEDLAIIEYGGTGNSALAIFLGDGNGQFHRLTSYLSGVETTSVAAADFDGDGHLDLAVANNAGNIKVFFGTGKGTFKKPITYKIAGSPWAVAAGDLNGDHHPDLAVANISGYVSVLLNDGTGKFEKPFTYSVGGGAAVDVKIADLRNDGREDLVVANASQGMVVLLNRGDGTFRKPTIYPPLCQNCVAPSACLVADFNLDGKLDVACATNIEDSYFFYGDGKGSFGAANPIHDTLQNQGGFSIAAGDFNNDKAPDLAIPIERYGKVAVLLNTK
jgi:hypothetical protein